MDPNAAPPPSDKMYPPLEGQPQPQPQPQPPGGFQMPPPVGEAPPPNYAESMSGGAGILFEKHISEFPTSFLA